MTPKESFLMGKHEIKCIILKRIANQEREGILPEWVGLLLIIGIVIAILIAN